ncbi:TonB-dependent receptor [Aquicoccus sp. SCR17]|nr:TonB-dependent receptor [Carideicomes alvinocaridis]
MAASISLRHLLMGSAAIVYPCSTLAQEAGAPLPLDPIVVESDREVQTQNAAPVTLIDGEEIEERQASTVAELLDSVPGVNLVNGSTPGGSAINIRGFGAWSGTYGNDQMVQIQVDGASSGAEELYRIGTQLYTDPALYKQAEVIRGSVGTFEYGSGAIGGMVRFETKDASDFTGGEPGFKARQYLGYGTNAKSFVSSTTLAYQPSQELELLFNYTWREQEDYEDGDGNTVANTNFATPSYLAKAKYHFGESLEHSLSLSYSDTQSAERDVPYDQFGQTSFGNVDRDIRSRTTVLKYEYDPLGNDLVNVEVSLSRAQQRIDQSPTGGPSNPLLDADHDYVTTKLTAKNSMAFSSGGADHDLRFGVEYILKDRKDASSAPGGDDRRYALFAVDDITMGGLTVTPALRYEDQEIDGTDNGYGTYSNKALMGGLSLRYEWQNGVSVFASAAYTEGLPILDDLTNPAYMNQSQKALTYEVGGAYTAGDVFAPGDALALKATLFQTGVSDITSYSGVTDVDVEGVELEASYSTDSGYYGDLNASFANGYNRTSGAANDYWAQQPADQVRLGLGKRFDNGLNVKWEGIYTLAMDRADTPTDSYFIHNVSVAYEARQGAFKGLEARVGIENLADTTYQSRLATRPAPGRSINFSLAKTF